MKISCTIRELGQLVRECKDSMCAYCVLKHFCNKDDDRPIETLVDEATRDDEPF